MERFARGLGASYRPSPLKRPRLLSDNGACFISHELKRYLETHENRYVRIKAYHPMTHGKIERYHRSMKNLILLDNYYAPAVLTERDLIPENCATQNESFVAKFEGGGRPG